MSSTLAAVHPSAAAPAPMRIVSSRPQRRARPKTLYAIVVVLGLFAVLLSQLGLSIGLGDGAYQIAKLKGESRALERTAASLSESIETLASPQNLAANAEVLGMVANSSPVYLRLSDGVVLGMPTPARVGAGGVPSAALVQNSTLAGIVPAATDSATALGSILAGTAGAPAATVAQSRVALPDGLIAGPETH